MSHCLSAAGTQCLHRSRRMAKLQCAILVAALASGCTTTHHLYPQAAAPDNALAGARVTVLTMDGQSVEMEVVESSAEYLAGTDASGRPQQFRLEDVRSIQVTEWSAGKTVALTAGIVGAIMAIAVASEFDAPPLSPE